jgi:hypothetical protein
MKHSEPTNPMESRTDRSAAPDRRSPIAAEMAGCCDLGMTREALQLARKILTQDRILAEEFSETVRTIGVHGDTLKKWAPKLQAAYDRQSREFKRAARFDMLSIYAPMGDWENARRFLSLRNAWSAAEMAFSMDVLLGLDLSDEAKPLSRRCIKCLPFATTRFEQSLLIDALADFFARTHQWNKAIAMWQNAPMEQPFRGNALEGIVQIHLARALEAVQRGLGFLAELKRNPDLETEVCIPGNELRMLKNDEKELLKFKWGIEKLLPEKARKELGVEAKNN